MWQRYPYVYISFTIRPRPLTRFPTAALIPFASSVTVCFVFHVRPHAQPFVCPSDLFRFYLTYTLQR